MTEFFLCFAVLGTFVTAFAILTNLQRERRQYNIQLKPNCLLTRHPVVFLTGKRSLFYFRKYWNAYPEVLAEHGYEVFTLHLPWRGPTRQSRMVEFLNSQASDKKFHFVCDADTERELRQILNDKLCTASITVLKSEAPQKRTTQSFTLNIAYKLHALQFANANLPKPEDLGLHFPVEAPRLLIRMQALGELDFIS